jgi:glyoxylase-like metal-dependent hydrolase (beta-lactamase superfamily II)
MGHHVGGRRLGRRALITELGSAGLGLTILAACGGSADDGGSTETTSAQRAPGAGSVPGGDGGSDASADEHAAGLRWEQVSFGFVAAYVLVRGGEAAVVDTGQSDGAAQILAGLELLDSSWSEVAHVVLTHSHGDHVGGLGAVLEAAPGATVYAGEADLASIRSPSPLQAVGDGDEVLGLGVIDTPGHTPGSISLFDTGTGLVVAGDAIVGDDGAIAGPSPEFTADMDTAVASLATLAALEPQVAAFGHGGAPITTDVTAQLQALAAG